MFPTYPVVFTSNSSNASSSPPHENQVLVIQSETFLARPDDVFANPLHMLGLSTWRSGRYKISNPGACEQMRPEVRAYLMEYLAPHNQRLYALLGEDFNWGAKRRVSEASLPRWRASVPLCFHLRAV
jgi:hypothetical protein